MNQQTDGQVSPRTSGFNPLPLVLVVLAIFVAVSFWTSSYTEQSALHRYCDNSDETVFYLSKVLTEKEPAGEEARRPYLIAAKLIFLVPRQSGEAVEAYTRRVQATIRHQCQ